MPRAGLGPEVVTARAADLADEIGLAQVTMALVAERLGVRAPSLYKHVDGQADLVRRIAVLAYAELGDELRGALQGRSGRDALAAAAHTLRSWVVEHPGRHAATNQADARRPDPALREASDRVLESFAAAVTGYDIGPASTIHAMRLFRCLFEGFAIIEAADGFQLAADTDETFEWLIEVVDLGLRGVSERSTG